MELSKPTYTYLLLTILVVMIGNAKAEPISIGLRTQIWSFMWRDGKTINEIKNLTDSEKIKWLVAEKNLDKASEIGAQWNIIILRQGVDGPDNFKRAIKIVDEHTKRGLYVMFRLIEDPLIYKKLSDRKSEEYGYNRDYYTWVKRIAELFQNRVRYYLVGNEVDHDLGHNLKKYTKTLINYRDYKRLLNTAYSAIKSVNKDLQVGDHGSSAFSVGLAIADEMFRDGHPVDAYNFWREFSYGRGWYAKNALTFTKLLFKESSQHRIKMVKETLEQTGNCDFIQFHHYFNWKSLPKIIAWTRQHMEVSGKMRPLIATEVGYRIPFKKGKTWDGRKTQVADLNKYNEHDHAVSLVKNFTVLFANNIKKALYWQIRFHHDRSPTAKLYRSTRNPTEFIPNKAATAYQVLTSMLNGLDYLPVHRLTDKMISEQRFSGIDKDLSIVWSRSGEKYIDSNMLFKVKSVFDIYGNTIDFSPEKKFKITETPVYIYWLNKN